MATRRNRAWQELNNIRERKWPGFPKPLFFKHGKQWNAFKGGLFCLWNHSFSLFFFFFRGGCVTMEKSIHGWPMFSCSPMFHPSPHPVYVLTPALGQEVPVNWILLFLFSSLMPSAKWSTKIRVETLASTRADWMCPWCQWGQDFTCSVRNRFCQNPDSFPSSYGDYWGRGEGGREREEL